MNKHICILLLTFVRRERRKHMTCGHHIIWIFAILLITGCATPRSVTVGDGSVVVVHDRPQIQTPALRAVMFPVNLIPNMISNFVVCLYPKNLWPVQYLLLPISVPVWGFSDAAKGYPFWSPSAFYE